MLPVWAALFVAKHRLCGFGFCCTHIREVLQILYKAVLFHQGTVIQEAFVCVLHFQGYLLRPGALDELKDFSGKKAGCSGGRRLDEALWLFRLPRFTEF